MKKWLQLAFERAVVRRALACAAVVGAVLITINHGHAILGGEVTTGRLVQMGLTLLVPYCVSTFSSVAAVRNDRRSRATGADQDN
ncbi:MAG: nitrate/nitrite transporter NrtS [Deltaproteobacteria bacterium]